jgi:hypothetical protein
VNDISIAAHEIGFFYNYIREILNTGPIAQEVEEERVIKKLKEEKKKVQPIYNATGQLIEFDEHGKHLDVTD